VLGTGIAVAGLYLRALASPSPHGYIEVLFAAPLILLGALLLGGGLLASGNRVLQVVGCLLAGWAIFDLVRLLLLLLGLA
jgi:hypothetical protein